MLATAFTGILPSDFCSRLVSDPSNTVLLECPFNCDDEVNDEAIVYVGDDLLNDCRGFGSGLCSDYSGKDLIQIPCNHVFAVIIAAGWLMGIKHAVGLRTGTNLAAQNTAIYRA